MGSQGKGSGEEGPRDGLGCKCQASEELGFHRDPVSPGPPVVGVVAGVQEACRESRGAHHFGKLGAINTGFISFKPHQGVLDPFLRRGRLDKDMCDLAPVPRKPAVKQVVSQAFGSRA